MPMNRQTLERLLRVNHAGEYGAKRLYEGQLAILGQSAIAPQLRHMAAQEATHLAAFDALLPARQVRPTLLHPLWHIAGFALGAATALMGEKAAMACTIAVEEVIDEHYQHQIAALDDDEAPLRQTLEKFRLEELEHKDTALHAGGAEMPGYPFLRQLIRTGSKTAIWLSQRF